MDKLAIAREVLSGIAMTSDEARTLDAILDRLSPPAPEVDEATRIWREMNAEGARACGSIPLMVQKWRNGEHDNDVSAIAEITYLRQVLSELIASKDAERDALGAEVDQLAMYLEDRDSELAAVSAAIGTTEFMDPPDGGSPTLAEQVGRMRAELAALRAENERLKATLNTLGTRWALPKAAERNTAEPATDTAPVVEVTVDSGMDAEAVEQAELLWAQLPVIRKWTSIPTHEKALVCHLLSTYRTEAEARGRREALEEVRKAVWDRLYPKNPESDWTPYARDMANAAKAAADEIGHLRQQGQTDAED